MSYQRVSKHFVAGRKLTERQIATEPPTFQVDAAQGYLRNDIGHIEDCDGIIVAVTPSAKYAGTYASRAAAARALDTLAQA